jgi:hypothetical protein
MCGNDADVRTNVYGLEPVIDSCLALMIFCAPKKKNDSLHTCVNLIKQREVDKTKSYNYQWRVAAILDLKVKRLYASMHDMLLN